MFNEKDFQIIQREVLSRRFDANETIFLERELTQLRAKTYQVVFPTLLARSFAPKAGDIANSAETYSYKVYEPVGKAQHKAYAAGDHPRVDVVAKEVMGKVRPISAVYGWHLNELREASRSNIQLPEVKARAARDFIERAIDETLAFGAIKDQAGALPSLGCNGLVNNPDVVSQTVMPGDWWFDPTPPDPKLILADLNKLVAKIGQDTKQAFEADTLLLPKAHFDYAMQTPFSALEGTSILEIFKKNNPQIKEVSPWHILDTAGASSAPRAVAYQKDPMVLEAVIPQEFEVLPPEARNFELLMHCHARCGGVKVYYPVAMRYMDFATS